VARKKKSQAPPRPKLRNWFPRRERTWLKLEPARLATVGGLLFSTCSVVIYFARQLAGAPVSVQEILTGVALTFLVSYTGTGFFVWYMLYLSEKERPQPRDQRKSQAIDRVEPPREAPPAAEVPEQTETEENV